MKGCEFCNMRHLMKKIMNSIEELPEFGVPLFDDPITDVFNAADIAFGILQCNCDEIKQDKSRPTPNAVDPATPRGERLSNDERQRRMNEQMFNTPGD